MISLIQGLGLLLQDNALHREPVATQAAFWREKSDRDIEDEISLLGVAKGQWLGASIVGWLALSLTGLAVVTHALWQDDRFVFSPTKVLLVLGAWVSMLFVLWLIASLFDKKAGFERWLTAFNSRAPISADADSIEVVSETIELAQRYPDVLAYKQRVSAQRPLRHEDIRLMRELGRQRRHAELVQQLNQLGS